MALRLCKKMGQDNGGQVILLISCNFTPLHWISGSAIDFCVKSGKISQPSLSVRIAQLLNDSGA